MVTLEQVEQLDERVRKVIALIESLRHENARLFAENRRLLEENQRLEYHLQESERRSLALSGAQEVLAKGLMGAIDRLDSVSHEPPTSTDPIATVGSPGGSSTQPSNEEAVLSGLLHDPVAEEAELDGADPSQGDERKMDIF
ncbi:MAG: cell division protein ZapB [Spirochaetia bacterium]